MNENHETFSPQGPFPRQSLTLAQYVLRRNGVPLGAPHSLKNMLHRSFGASTFAGFWQYCNSIWGYSLGKYVYAPLQQGLPVWLALISDFCRLRPSPRLSDHGPQTFGSLHFYSLVLLLGVGVVVARSLGMDFSGRSWGVRAGVNLIYLIACFVAMLLAKQIFGFP